VRARIRQRPQPRLGARRGARADTTARSAGAAAAALRRRSRRGHGDVPDRCRDRGGRAHPQPRLHAGSRRRAARDAAATRGTGPRRPATRSGDIAMAARGPRHVGPARRRRHGGDARVPSTPRSSRRTRRSAAVHTRAVVVVHRRPDRRRTLCRRATTPTMPLPGWSMTKTLTHALLGARVQQGALDPARPARRARMARATNAARSASHDLLAMSGGLAWNEDYDDPASDALRMLFGSGDHAAVYAAQPRDRAPGTSFLYASGATNLLCLGCCGARSPTTATTGRSRTRLVRAARHAQRGARGRPERHVRRQLVRLRVGARLGAARLALRQRRRRSAADASCRRAGSPRDRRPQPASGGRYGHQVWLDADPDGDGPLRAGVARTAGQPVLHGTATKASTSS
jgi:hypothetical protein